MANLRTNNLSGEGGINAIRGSVFFNPTSNNGNNGYDSLTVPAGSDFAYGTGDFTFEAYVWMDSFGSDTRLIFSQTVSGTNYILFGITTSGQVTTILGHSNQVTSTGTIALNSWNHVAVSRSSGTVKVFCNGVASSGSSITTDLNDTTRIPTIGKYTHSTQLAWKGYISNFRICKGHAVYTTDFTPPTSELEVHYLSENDKTVLLCCQDSDNPLQEATGKTITAYGDLHEGDDVELVTNSGFTTDISGWTASGVQFTHSSGALMHFGNGSTQRNIYQDVTTVIGRKYVARVLASSAEASTAYWQVGPTDDMTTVGYIADNNNSAQLEYKYYFTATSTTTRIRFYSYDSSNSSNVRSYWYLASIKLAPRTKAPKLIPPYGVDAGNTFGGAISMNSPSWMYFPTGKTEERGRGRAVSWLGVDSPNYTKQLDFFDIQSTGTTTKFGEISDTVGLGAGMSSSTRGVFAGGTKPAVGNMNLLEFITIATTGNALDFGGISTLFRYGGGISNSTRGLICGAYQGGGASGTKNVIQYITIATLGNTADFGDIIANSNNGIFGAGTCQSSTRGITFGGGTGPSQVNEINYITIGTLGNSVDFGDLSAAKYYLQGVSSSTRGVVAGGYQESPGFTSTNVIEFITIASTGDATDFGDLITAARQTGSSGGSNKIRGVFVGGGVHPSYNNTIEFVTIATTGNASDFGDISTSGGTPYGSVAVSDSHGGLS